MPPADSSSEFAVRSMTGFGMARGPLGQGPDAPQIEVALKSVNHRYLKIGFRLPDSLMPYERAIEERLRQRLARGSVQCQIRVRTPGTVADVRVDEALAAQLTQRLGALAIRLGIAGPSLDLIASLPGVIFTDSEEEADESERREAILRVVDAAVEPLQRMRADEGAATGKDLDRRCDVLRGLAEAAAERSPAVVQHAQRRLTERLEELLRGKNVPVDPDQIAREVALLADRIDIAEEVARLSHHARAFQQALRTEREAGRRLDFVAQEMLREANTMGAKGNDSELASLVVEMKAEIEKIKEQVQNLE